MIAALLLMVLPMDLPNRTQCDLVEVNHYYGNEGNLIFTQLILWDFTPKGMLCQGWTMASAKWSLIGRKLTIWRRDRFEIIEFGDWRETWTQFDPERQNATENPHHKRKWE